MKKKPHIPNMTLDAKNWILKVINGCKFKERKERAWYRTTLRNMGKSLTSEQSKYRKTTWQVVIGCAGSFCRSRKVN